MTGYITKGIGGFYYVKTSEGIVECKPRGIFRKQKITPVAGDVKSAHESAEKNTDNSCYGLIAEVVEKTFAGTISCFGESGCCF